MDVKQITQALGLETYPESFETFYANLDDSPACDLALIEKAQEQYKAFGNHYAWVREAAEQINADPVYSAFVKIVHAYLQQPDCEYKLLPVPALNGTPKRDGTMLMTLVPFIPESAAIYLKGGFSQEETAGYLHAYGSCLSSTRTRTGYVGLDRTYFMWLHRFAKAQIFRVHGIQFEFTKLNKNCTYLKNKETGKIQPVMSDGHIHASGKMLVVIAFLWLTSPVSGHLIGRLEVTINDELEKDAEVVNRAYVQHEKDVENAEEEAHE